MSLYPGSILFIKIKSCIDILVKLGFMSTTEILEQVLDPFVDCLTPDAAQKIVGLRADSEAQSRLDQLAERANEGLLTEEERAELEKLRATFHVITLLQSKARRILRNGSKTTW